MKAFLESFSRFAMESFYRFISIGRDYFSADLLDFTFGQFDCYSYDWHGCGAIGGRSGTIGRDQ